jgi:acetyl-CoA C-acetyltransferase
MNEVFIMSIARTPIGSLGGVISTITAPQLGATVMKAAMLRANINPDQVQEVYMGNVLSANVGQAPAQQASIAAGIPTNTPCTTINKVCASGMKSIMLGAQSIMTGINEIVVAGGMESMSNTPYYLDRARSGYRYGHAQMIDGIIRDGLWDPYSDFAMGNAGEICAKEYNISREAQDEYAVESYHRAIKATADGSFGEEIVPVEVIVGKEKICVKEDEEVKKVKFEKIPTLRPAFQKDGTITAANASKINDGAAAVILMSGQKVRELGLKPLAKIIGFADASQDPAWFTTTPSKAMPKAMHMAGLEMEDADLAEINEAFAVVNIVNNQLLNLNPDNVNIYGGAVALGHPIGASGARITVTLLNALKQKGKRIGVAGICNGGGGASALVIENV